MKLEVLSNVFLKEKYLLLELSAPKQFLQARPGQFLHIRIEDSFDPLLRRPLSIHDVERRVSPKSRKEKAVVKILYELAGKGTKLLSEKRVFTELDALGPLGNGFDIKRASEAKTAYIIAGGMGVAPLVFLARKIRESSKAGIKVLIGGRNKEHIIGEKDFKGLGCEVHIATEDGSQGFKGRVSGLLLDLLAKPKNRLCPEEKRAIFACGPKPMLAAIARIAQEKKIAAQVSLEEFMGCGVGACLGCVIRTTFGYKRICNDGPVFDASEVIWQE